MRSKILRSSIGLLLGCSVAGPVVAVNTPVTASNSQGATTNLRQPKYIIAAVLPLEVGTYGAMAAKAVVGDKLTPDHIPSFAAVKYYKEKVSGGAITGTAETNLRNNTCTIVYLGTIHKDFSRTYAGRNTSAQIAADGKDASSLKAAFTADTQKIRPELIKIYKAADVDKAFALLNQCNINSKLYT